MSVRIVKMALGKGHPISMITGRWVVALEEVKEQLKKEEFVCVLVHKKRIVASDRM